MRKIIKTCTFLFAIMIMLLMNFSIIKANDFEITVKGVQYSIKGPDGKIWASYKPSDMKELEEGKTPDIKAGGLDVKIDVDASSKEVKLTKTIDGKEIEKVFTLRTLVDAIERNKKELMPELSGYGHPDDLSKMFDPSYENSVAGLIVKHSQTIAAVILYIAIVMLGINLILNRNKAEERTNTMSGLTYICIGVILFTSVLIIYGWIYDFVGNDTNLPDDAQETEEQTQEGTN